jgi:hypothetical protein
MSQSRYFSTRIGRQTISGIMTIGSFPLLLLSGQGSVTLLSSAGLLILFGGMLSVPLMSFTQRMK